LTNRFRSVVLLLGERTVPSGITLFGVSGGRWNLIEIPKTILKLSLGEQLAALPKLMAAYQRRYKGACPFFGRLTGFKFVRCLDYSQFDAEGRLVEHVAEAFSQGELFG